VNYQINYNLHRNH